MTCTCDNWFKTHGAGHSLDCQITKDRMYGSQEELSIKILAICDYLNISCILVPATGISYQIVKKGKRSK